MVELETTDFALDEMAGRLLHDRLHVFRGCGPVSLARFGGAPAFVIAGYDALLEAFLDERAFPGHSMYEMAFEPAIGKTFISMSDSAEHLRYRKLTTPAFRSRAVARYEAEGLAALANELVDELAGRDEFDLVADFTDRFPYLVIARLLGISREREGDFHGWAKALLSYQADPEGAQQARRAMAELLEGVIEERRRAPQDDVISELAFSKVDGRHLTDEEIISHVRLLFPTGSDTTHGALGNLLFALLNEGDAWREIAGDSQLIEGAVAEGFRWESPIAVLPRVSASEAVDFHGTTIPPKSWVLFAIAGANRDPGCFEEPDRFDIRRKAQPNLVFGRGPKSCPGMHLAQKSLSVALQVLSQRFPELELVDADAAVPRRTVLRSPDALRVRTRSSG